MGAPTILQDLVVVMVVAAAATIVFYRLRQPVVLGYLLAGVLVGPNTLRLISDTDSIHGLSDLGIIFLTNMELGYLTPPVGMNLFFTAYRFGKPLPEVFSAALPAVGVLAIGVLLVTFVPWLATGLPQFLR